LRRAGDGGELAEAIDRLLHDVGVLVAHLAEVLGVLGLQRERLKAVTFELAGVRVAQDLDGSGLGGGGLGGVGGGAQAAVAREAEHGHQDEHHGGRDE